MSRIATIVAVACMGIGMVCIYAGIFQSTIFKLGAGLIGLGFIAFAVAGVLGMLGRGRNTADVP